MVAAEKWLIKCLSSHLDNAVVLLNTSNVFDRSTAFAESRRTEQSISNEPLPVDKCARIYANYCEAAIVVRIVTAMMKAGVRGRSIGIIAPYTAQVELLKKCMQCVDHALAGDIEVNTVDQYQGRDKEIIIYSCTKCDNPQLVNQSTSVREFEILEDFRRLTVAITRAKHKLIIVGDVNSLQMYTPFKTMFMSLSGIVKVNLDDGQKGFQWDIVLGCMQEAFVANDQ